MGGLWLLLQQVDRDRLIRRQLASRNTSFFHLREQFTNILQSLNFVGRWAFRLHPGWAGRRFGGWAVVPG